MPFRSKAQQRYLESSASPLTSAQKREWESATDFKSLPARLHKGHTQIRNPAKHQGKLKNG